MNSDRRSAQEFARRRAFEEAEAIGEAPDISIFDDDEDDEYDDDDPFHYPNGDDR